MVNTIDRINRLGVQGPAPGTTGTYGPSGVDRGTQGGQPAGSGDSSFRDALTAAAEERSLQLSGHALRRLEQRQIPLAGEQLDRLQKAMETLSQRGSRQSLVMLDQVAYVVHVPSHTVVTAVQPDQSKEKVFTQIDSVVIA